MKAETLRKLAELNLAPEQMAGVLDILADLQEDEEQRKANQRERVRKHRMKQTCNVTETLHEGYNPSPKGSSPTPPSPNPQPIPPSPPKGGSSPVGFDQFWELFPNKVGKPVAVKAFSKALQRTDLGTLMDGLRRYVAKTDDRPWCNPTTFLNQDRWNDQPAGNLFSPSPPRQTAYQQRHQNAIDVFDRKLGLKANDEFTGNTLDLAAGDYRPH